MRRYLLVVALFAVVLSGCATGGKPQQEVVAKHPWTDKPVLDHPQQFRFAIIGDFTNKRQPDVVEDALRKIDLMRPAFVMSVGDHVQGYSDDPVEISRQRDTVISEMSQLGMRFYFVAGNHDVSNANMVKDWGERFGRSYYSFVYQNVLFVCLNSNDPGEGHISSQQVEYVRRVLEQNKGVRWTFVFMHHPLWIQDANEAGWKAISELLAQRSYTAFAGHFHEYIYSQRNGRDQIVMATTGGDSPLRGEQVGEFHHIAWVTMTDHGPEIANLLLSGILPKDVVTEDMSDTNGVLLYARHVHTSGIAAQEQEFRSGKGTIELVNDRKYELTVAGKFRPNANLKVEPAEINVVLPPGERKTVELAATSNEPIDLAKLTPLTLDLSTSYCPPGRKPVVIPSEFTVDVRGAMEGQELLQNASVDRDGSPWFTWVNDPKPGTVKLGEGTVQVAMKPSTNVWMAGLGQLVEGMRAGARYRLAVRASDKGGAGLIAAKFTVGEEDKAVEVAVDGRRSEGMALQVGQEPGVSTAEFVMPQDLTAKQVKLILMIGNLQDAAIESVSLREMVGGKPAGEQ